ncbi:MAG: hypothetical protein IPH84_05195 [Bacteroidales bacterium]|nr:hypothetical protein [Bacteroidales bacterium]
MSQNASPLWVSGSYILKPTYSPIINIYLKLKISLCTWLKLQNQGGATHSNSTAIWQLSIPDQEN